MPQRRNRPAFRLGSRTRARPSRTARAKMSGRNSLRRVNGSQGAMLAFKVKSRDAQHRQEITDGKRTCQRRSKAPIYGALRIRTEFAQPARSSVERGICRDHHTMACGLRGQAGAGCRPVGWLATFDTHGEDPRVEIASGRQASDLPDKGRRRGSDRSRDIGAIRRRLKGGEPSYALFSG